jgi:Mg2+-importing ATPase
LSCVKPGLGPPPTVPLSLTLDVVQEHRAELTAEALRDSVAIQADVIRNGKDLSVPVATLVPGDVVKLRTGDLVPADGVVLEAQELQINEALMTGEPFPAFARIDPDQKRRIIAALRHRNHVVGFMGDGVNDAPAIHAAHVGISVTGATEVARAAADIILLAPDLTVLASGVREGRRTFANILKYVRMGTSSNFGNMLSMALASIVLPFLPLLPLQILLNNLIYDLSEIGIPFDEVDREDVARPEAWDMTDILRFTIIMGVISSLFDAVTFAVLLKLFRTDAAMFQTGWFVESIMTQILVIFVIRSRWLPWRANRPHPILIATSLGALGSGVALAMGPWGELFGFTPVSPALVGTIVAIAAAYLIFAELAKHFAITNRRRL